jgi:hypothetical protein
MRLLTIGASSVAAFAVVSATLAACGEYSVCEQVPMEVGVFEISDASDIDIDSGTVFVSETEVVIAFERGDEAWTVTYDVTARYD